MKKNLILVGLLSVILVFGIVSVVSAVEITGDVGLDCSGCGLPGENCPTGCSMPNLKTSNSGCPSGYNTARTSNDKTCCVNAQRTGTTGRWISDLFSGSYTGKVTITGEMTQDKCDSYCSLSTGTLSSSSKQCDCSPAEILRNGRTFCTNLDSQKVCGELGRKTTANDGTQVTFTRERTGFFSQARILVNIRESTDSLSYQ